MNKTLPLEISALPAQAAQCSGALLLDIREANERLTGYAQHSVHAPMSAGFENWVQRLHPDQPLLLICASGVRSLRAAAWFRQMGFTQVQSVTGGHHAWQTLQLPMTVEFPADLAMSDRYSRHYRLPEVGIEGQRKLLQSRVLLIGAGGLGSPVALYLAAAGIGFIRIVDDDCIERSNLQRQIIHRDGDIGKSKVASAKAAITALNPDVKIEAVDTRFDKFNSDDLTQDCDLVIDGADNFITRYLLNSTCIKYKKPWVYGAVQRFEGQVSVFAPHVKPSIAPCYRCLFSEPPLPEEAPNCAEAGVLGVMPGIIGLLQANEAIKILLGIGEPLIGRLQCFDGLAGKFRELRFKADPACPECA